MPKETTRHREISDQYVRLGSRGSLKRLRERLAVDGKPPALSTLELWSSRFGWQNRVAEIERSEDAARGAVIRERIERQQREAEALQAKGISLLRSINASGHDDPALLSVALRFVEIGVKMERGILGDEPEPREPAEQLDGSDPALRRFSAEELEELAVMLERANERDGAA